MKWTLPPSVKLGERLTLERFTRCSSRFDGGMHTYTCSVRAAVQSDRAWHQTPSLYAFPRLIAADAIGQPGKSYRQTPYRYRQACAMLVAES